MKAVSQSAELKEGLGKPFNSVNKSLICFINRQVINKLWFEAFRNS